MATRKIRVTMSGTQVDSQGPIVDIDFNDENLDADIDVDAVTGSGSVVKEYTVDVDAGVYDLDIIYKNDLGGDLGDRNFVIESIEAAADGVNYNGLVVTEENSNLTTANFGTDRMGWTRTLDENFDAEAGWSETNLRHITNSSYDPSAERTDTLTDGRWLAAGVTDPGANPQYHWEFKLNPMKIWTSGKYTFKINF